MNGRMGGNAHFSGCLWKIAHADARMGSLFIHTHPLVCPVVRRQVSGTYTLSVGYNALANRPRLDRCTVKGYAVFPK